MTENGITIEDTSRARLQATPAGVRAFCEARFGLSVHWGLYVLNTAGSEWTYHLDHIPFATYQRRMEKFNPIRFCADEWADLMVEAGQMFLLITAKHHDGFCLWDTGLTDFKVTNTAFGRDVLAELAPALAARGIALHFYYSLVDWTHPRYRDDWPAYVAYYQGQLRELCTGYGKIGGILFDGYWPNSEWLLNDKPAQQIFLPGNWDLAGTYDLIHSLQPDAVITNNTHVLPLQGEDYQVWELDLPGENKTLKGNCTQVGDKPTACWWNLNAGWSYQPWNHAVKNAASLLETYRAVTAKGGVFLLNVGPRPWGDIHPEEQQVLRELGQAIRRYQS